MKEYKHNHMLSSENILRKKLSNGITLLARENPFSQTAVINASIPCGSYLDPTDKTGLAHFVSNCLNTGTFSHNFQQLSELLESSGASIGINCSSRTYTVQGTCLAEDLPLILGLMKEILDEPSFPQDHVELHRQRVLSVYELHLHDPESMADERLDKLLFGDHPYGRPELGTTEETNSITRDDLFAFHKRFIGPENMVVSISGGVPAEKILDECEKLIGSWQKPQESVHTEDFFPDISEPDHNISEHIEIPEKSEISLILGTLGPRRGSRDFLPAVLGNSILGEFGMMGRIGKAVREENGLAYYAGSSLTSLSMGGCWSVDAGVNPANLEKAAALIISELKRFTTEKVSQDELDDVKSFYLGSLPLSLESNSGAAGLMLNMEKYDLGLDYLMQLPDRVKAVTPEIILETARKWIDPEKLIRVTAGTLEA